MAARPVLTAELKAQALELFTNASTAAAAKLAGVTPRTVQRWARDAGVLPPEERARQTAAAVAEVKRRQAEAYEKLLPLLTHVVERSLTAQLEIAQTTAEVMRAARDGRELSAELATRMRALEAITAVVTPRALVSMSTRGIHDLQLLTGGDTERAGGDINVYLAALAAPDDPADAPKIIDLQTA